MLSCKARALVRFVRPLLQHALAAEPENNRERVGGHKTQQGVAEREQEAQGRANE